MVSSQRFTSSMNLVDPLQKGPTGSTISTTFAYTGCWEQTSLLGISGSYAFNKGALGYGQLFSVDGNSAPAPRSCAQKCLQEFASSLNFFGVVNMGTSSVSCWCGLSITGSPSSEVNCVACLGPNSGGTCGKSTGTAGITIAVYGRGF